MLSFQDFQRSCALSLSLCLVIQRYERKILNLEKTTSSVLSVIVRNILKVQFTEQLKRQYVNEDLYNRGTEKQELKSTKLTKLYDFRYTHSIHTELTKWGR